LPGAFGFSQYGTGIGLQGMLLPDVVFIQTISAPHPRHFPLCMIYLLLSHRNNHVMRHFFFSPPDIFRPQFEQ
jgi:hypothetical protein